MKDTYLERCRICRGKGYNCAQSVACAFIDVLPIDETTLYKVMEGFGGGMGGYEGTCGAISGAVAAASLFLSSGTAEQPTKGHTYELTKEIFDRFVKKTGSSVCKELKGIDTNIVLYPCEACIEDAVHIVRQVLKLPT